MFQANINITHNLDFTRAKKFTVDSVRHAILMQGLELSNYIREKKLTGQILNVQTGRLRNSVHSNFKESANQFTATVSTNVKYAGAHEYGFKGSVSVKSHKRKISMAFGKPISTRDIIIGSFRRTMNLPERSFMRSALKDRENAITTALHNAIDKGMEFL